MKLYLNKLNKYGQTLDQSVECTELINASLSNKI